MFNKPMTDLLTTVKYKKLLIYTSPIPDPVAGKEDSFQHQWNNLEVYASPPVCPKPSGTQSSNVIIRLKNEHSSPSLATLRVVSRSVHADR